MRRGIRRPSALHPRFQVGVRTDPRALPRVVENGSEASVAGGLYVGAAGRGMSEEVSWLVELVIKPGQLDNFRALTGEMVESSRRGRCLEAAAS